MSISRFSAIGCLFASAAITLVSPAPAQSAPEEIIVTGRYGKVPDSVQSLSQTVSYTDLDLSTEAGRKILKKRVSLTARYLCDKLGESSSATPPAPSCREAATQDAWSRVETVEAHSAPRGTTWVAPAPWQAPYPEDWDSRYP